MASGNKVILNNPCARLFSTIKMTILPEQLILILSLFCALTEIIHKSALSEHYQSSYPVWTLML